MAKVKTKAPLKTLNKVLFTVFVLLLVAVILIIAISPAKVATTDAAAEEIVDEVVIDELKSGTYGGVNFASLDDVVAFYNECYDHTKTLTSQYKNAEGKTETFYTLLGEDDLQVESILIEGKENSMINNLVPGVVGGLFSNGLDGLPPCTNRNPEMDVDINGDSLTTSRLVADDLLAANVVDNGDGTITITLQPKMFNMSAPGMDCQGHVFKTLGDIAGVVSSITVLSFSQGDANENVKVNYMGGTAIVKINVASKEVVEADYHEVAQVAVTHANVAVLKDKSASLTIKYDMHFPASDDYLMNTKQITRL